MRVLVAWVAILVGAVTPPLVAQAPSGPQAVAPRFELAESRTDGTWGLYVEIPEGWALYAPGDATLGLPLTARWLGPEAAERPAALHGPTPVEEVYPWGSALVHRERVRLSLDSPAPGARALALRWALCRVDLCVPGESVVVAETGGG
jgi:hypothetical protein